MKIGIAPALCIFPCLPYWGNSEGNINDDLSCENARHIGISRTITTVKQDGKYFAVRFMKKQEINKLKLVDHIKNEKHLMGWIEYPYIVNMIGYAKEDRYVYIAMEGIGDIVPEVLLNRSHA